MHKALFGLVGITDAFGWVCYWEGDPAYLTVSWIILDIDAKLLLKGCWMWVCVPLSSSLPLVSLCVCVCVRACVCVCVCVCNDARQRGGESTAQHKRLHHSLLSLSISSTSPLVFSAFWFSLPLWFFYLSSYLLCWQDTVVLHFQPSLPPPLLSSFGLCFRLSLLPHPFPSVSVDQHSDVIEGTHVHTCWWTVML